MMQLKCNCNIFQATKKYPTEPFIKIMNELLSHPKNARPHFQAQTIYTISYFIYCAAGFCGSTCSQTHVAHA